MTIKYEWLLPFVMPFVLFGMIKSLFWMAGAAIEDPEILVLVSLGVGGILAFIIMGILSFDNTTLGSFTIGKKGGK